MVGKKLPMIYRKIPALFIFISIALVFHTASVAQTLTESCDVSQLFVEANQYYNQGAVDEARSRYEQLSKTVRNGDIYYNLGNIYLKTGEIGRAIHSYRTAALFMPRNQDLKANLAYARSQTKDRLEGKGRFSILRSLCFWYDAFSLQELATALVVVNALFWTIALIRIWFRNELLYWSFLASLILLVTIGTTWGVKAYQPLLAQEGVVITGELPLRSGNDLKSTVLFYLHDGAEVDVVSQNNGWVKIQLPDGKKGWAQKSFVGIVGN